MKESYINACFEETVLRKFPDREKQLVSAFEKRLFELRKDNAGATKEKMLHLERQILPGIAAYEVLQTVMEKSDALNTVHGYVETNARSMQKKLTSLLRVPLLYRLVPGAFVIGTRKMFGKSAGFDAVEHQTSGGVWRIDMTRCPYNDTCIHYGCPELCCCFCDSDDIAYGNMHKKLIWNRTKTLGRGNDCCDFCIKAVK